MKRISDVVISALGIFLLSPFLLIIAALIKVNMGSPVFFRQPRPGCDEKIFNLVKFRTMVVSENVGVEPISDVDRITPLGEWLRKTSLDELPELWNVLKGDMSLVGPRPLLVEYLPLYSSWQKRRHEVRPGITGWAQVNGRNAISWQDKFKLDLWYVENWSIWLDIKILMLTVVRVLQREGITQDELTTMEKFTGDN